MIPLEYIIAQCHWHGTSYAIDSHRTQMANPAIIISQNGNQFDFTLTGLRLGAEEPIPDNNPRATRVDFYIGLDHLLDEIGNFPQTNVPPVGLVDGLRIPVGRERKGGRRIRWQGTVTRVEASDVYVAIPPMRLRYNNAEPINFNVDRETSPYPIVNGNRQIIRQIHFGIEHNFNIGQHRGIRWPQLRFSLQAGQYATVLNALLNSVDFHVRV